MKRIEDINQLPAGSRVRIRQETIAGDTPASHDSAIEGTVISCKPDKTGSWFAHGKQDKFWLLRLRLAKDSGEMTDLVVDRGTRVEVLSAPQGRTS